MVSSGTLNVGSSLSSSSGVSSTGSSCVVSSGIPSDGSSLHSGSGVGSSDSSNSSVAEFSLNSCSSGASEAFRASGVDFSLQSSSSEYSGAVLVSPTIVESKISICLVSSSREVTGSSSISSTDVTDSSASNASTIHSSSFSGLIVLTSEAHNRIPDAKAAVASTDITPTVIRSIKAKMRLLKIRSSYTVLCSSGLALLHQTPGSDLLLLP